MNTCTVYAHPELSCITHGTIGAKPCEPCQLKILQDLMPKAQALILKLSDGDVANYIEHVGDCPGDDTCDPTICKDVAAVNAVMGWGRR